MTMDAIESVLPNKGLFHDYMKMTSGGELCPRFRFFAFASIVGAVIARNLWFKRSTALFKTLYPNIWVVLVGPQGVGHKSTALTIARNVMDKLPRHLRPRLLASKLTPEALVRALATHRPSAEVIRQVGEHSEALYRKAQGLLYASEFGVLLGKEKYNTGLIGLLTDLYDTPDEWSAETIMRGEEMLYEVCISLVGASTPDWLQTMLPSDAFKGGFMSRLLLVLYPPNWNVRVADPPPLNDELFNNVVKQLEVIAGYKGEVTWTEEAHNIFSDWYNTIDTSIFSDHVAAYLERKQDHILRLSMLLSAAKGEPYLITADTMNQSRAILESIEPETMSIIETIAVEPRMRIAMKILSTCKSWTPESTVLAKVWHSLQRSSEFSEIVSLLIRMKRLKIESRGGIIYYKAVEQPISR